MANSFETYTSRDVTSLTVVGNHTVAAGTTETIIGLTVANVSDTQVEASVLHFTGSAQTHIVKSAPIPVGGSLVPIGGDQKIVLTPNDRIRVVSTDNVDVIMSVLAIT